MDTITIKTTHGVPLIFRGQLLSAWAERRGEWRTICELYQTAAGGHCGVVRHCHLPADGTPEVRAILAPEPGQASLHTALQFCGSAKGAFRLLSAGA